MKLPTPFSFVILSLSLPSWTNGFITPSLLSNPSHRGIGLGSETTAALTTTTSHTNQRITTMPPLLVSRIRISSPSTTTTTSPYASSKTALQMNRFLDFLQNNNPFLTSREGDFIPLENSNDAFGPGPLIVAYAVPDSMETEELMDMVEDGMPQRQRGDVKIRRMDGAGKDSLLDLTVEEALDRAMEGDYFISGESASDGDDDIGAALTLANSKPSINPVTITTQQTQENGPCPILYFSGVTNSEMMETYQIIANEIYEETNGVHWLACAKVVPPAMKKSMRRVLEEISGDHAEAMRMRREEAETAKTAEG